MEQIKQQIRDMVENGNTWNDVVSRIYYSNSGYHSELYVFADTVFMEDELIEESHDDFRVLERMWNKIMYRIRHKTIPGREVLDWIDNTYSRSVIGPVTHNELHERLADFWDQEEQAAKEHREERMYTDW